MGVIVVGVDHSEGAKAALRFAVGEAKLRHASLRVVHAWQLGYVAAGFIPGSYPELGDELEELRDAAEAALEATLHEIVPATGAVEIERRVVDGRRRPFSSTSRAMPSCLWSDRAGSAASAGCCSAPSASNVPTTRPARS